VKPFRKGLHDRYGAQRANGPKLPSESEAREQLTDEAMISYVTDGGHVMYEWSNEDLVVSYISGDTAQIARALGSVVGSGSWIVKIAKIVKIVKIVKTVVAYVAPDDPIHLLLPEEVAHETSSNGGCCGWWMSPRPSRRVAFPCRFRVGPGGAAGPLLPANSGPGSWRCPQDAQSSSPRR
jgi:hypothetical protein